MRVLVAHNFYGSSTPSGENVLVDNESRWLRDAGHDVSVFSAHNDDVSGPAGGLLRIARRPSAPRSIREHLERFEPDVVHLHNTFPFLGPGLVRACVASPTPVVWTIHNFRLSCLGGSLYREGELCTRCPDEGSDRPGITHGCYGNRARSALMARDLRSTRTQLDGIDRFVAISDYMAGYLHDLGIAADRISTKYNSCPSTSQRWLDSLESPAFLFAGRLHQEKGVSLLLAAWERRTQRAGRLVIAGGGALAASVAEAARRDPSIEAVGLVDPADLPDLRARTTCAVHPSVWREPSGSIQESYAAARPVIATDVGAHAEVLNPAAGILCDPTVESLAAAFDTMIEHCAQRPDVVRQMAKAAADLHDEWYSPDAAVASLVDVYSELV